PTTDIYILSLHDALTIYSNHPVISSVIVPVPVCRQCMLCMIKAVEFKAVHNFPLNDAVESLDISVFFRCGNVGKLLVSFCRSEILLHIICNELRAVIIADGHSFNSILLIDSSKSVNYIHLPDAFLKDLVNRFSGECIQDGQQIIIAFIGMYINVFNIQTEIFHGIRGLYPAVLDEPAFSACPDNLSQ